MAAVFGHHAQPARGASRLPTGGPGIRGFTLLELLLVSAMGGVLLIGAITMLVSHIRSSNRMAALLHLQDHCGWVQHLINREIEQAERASGGASTLNLTVPGFSRPVSIRYTLIDGGVIQRTGPTIDADGHLDVPSDPSKPYTPRTDLVARDVTAFAVDVTNPRSPKYTITMRSNGVETTINQATDRGDGGAYCRAREIADTNP